ncbi:MAG: hypothetical protein GQ558_08405 [Thermoplasmata archaeon]|nr:hypothetical protein [Thermoplasmata archaeon]
MAHNHWVGQVDDPEEGVRQLRTVGLTIYLLALIPVGLCFLMTIIGGILWPLILAWSVLTSFLIIVGLWAMGQETYDIGRYVTTDKIWSRFLIDEGQLEDVIDKVLLANRVPFIKMSRWTYSSYYEVPQGLYIGVSRTTKGTDRRILMIHIEGIDGRNIAMARSLRSMLGSIEIHSVPEKRTWACTPTPSGDPSSRRFLFIQL